MKAFFPVLTWLVWVTLIGPEFRQNQWECLLIMFAAIELVPKGLAHLGLRQKEWYALAAAGLCAAYFFDGYWFLAGPYLLWAIWLTLREATEVLFLKKSQLAGFVRVFALGYWATGAAFAVLYLADISPLGFDPVIVSLTAAHFHVAGFRGLWLAGAACLLVGIGLATVYALRFQLPLEWVGIPNMKIWHGTLNTLGFAWFSLIAWGFLTMNDSHSS